MSMILVFIGSKFRSLGGGKFRIQVASSSFNDDFNGLQKKEGFSIPLYFLRL